jgi:hypothetical protein
MSLAENILEKRQMLQKEKLSSVKFKMTDGRKKYWCAFTVRIQAIAHKKFPPL